MLRFWEQPPARATDVNLVLADESFHETLAELSGSRIFPTMLRNINQRLHALRIRDFVDPVRLHRTFEQHHAILHGPLDGDARLARAVIDERNAATD